MRRPDEKIPRHTYHDAADDPNRLDPMGKPKKALVSRIFPFLVFGFIVLLILSQEFPQVQDTVDRLIRPQVFNARMQCQAAALEQASRPDYARIIRQGEVVDTHKGLLVHNIIVGEMDERGQERRVPFHCYMDAGGNMISNGRTEE
jgi:hypothetical protein